MAGDYVTIAELRAEIDGAADTADAVLQRLVDAAAKRIDRFCGREDGFVADATATARYYVGSGEAVQPIDECASITAVAVKDSPSDDEADYVAWTLGTIGTTAKADVFPARGDPRNPTYGRTPYTMLVVGPNGDYSSFTSGHYAARRGFSMEALAVRGVTTVKVTAKWGYAATVPDDVKEATIMQAARWWNRLQSAMADAAGSPEMGMVFYRQRIDPDIAAILVDGRYVRRSVG